jgi:hypothetical protein
MKNIRMGALPLELAIIKKNNQIAITNIQIKAHITKTRSLTK